MKNPNGMSREEKEYMEERQEEAFIEYIESKLKQAGGKIHLLSLDDHIKGNWYVWTCQLEGVDGKMIAGRVQATGDGNLIAPETFEPDEE